MRRVGSLRSVLNGDLANITLRIDIENSVFVEIARLRNRSRPKLDQQSVCVDVVAYFHGTNLRSKKALWTVSPSANRITRRYRFSISGTRTQRRIRPSACGFSRSGVRIARSIHSSSMILRSGRRRIASKYAVVFTITTSGANGYFKRRLTKLIKAGLWRSRHATGCGAHHRPSTVFPPCTDRAAAAPRKPIPWCEPARTLECARGVKPRAPGSPRPAAFCPWSRCRR
jgi:hypothetical protein